MLKKIIELTRAGGPTEFYCPACGKPVYQPHRTPKRCEHILFSYNDSIEEFDYVAKSLEEIREAASDAPDPVAYILRKTAARSSSACCISVTTKGVDCGSVSETVTIAIDIDPKP